MRFLSGGDLKNMNLESLQGIGINHVVEIIQLILLSLSINSPFFISAKKQ